MSAVARIVLAILVSVAAALVATPAQADGPRLRAVLTFEKNQASPSHSRLVWRLQRREAGAWKVVEQAAWRAGSGALGRAGRDACAKGRGWLPNGSYSVRYHRDYAGSLIKGRAFRLSDQRCADGTTRNELFIHTEQGAGNRQCADRPGDQVCRWELPRINDYKSAGCVKLSPAHLRDLADRFDRVFRPGVRYSLDRLVLRVV